MRKLYIIAPDAMVTAQVASDADAAGCSEIARGIPPMLARNGVTGSFPFVYTEPDDPDAAPLALAITVLRNTFKTTRTAAQVNNSIDAITVILKKIVTELR